MSDQPASEIENLREWARWTRHALGEECRYDHHGCCQAHFLDERPCPMEAISAYVTALDAGEIEHPRPHRAIVKRGKLFWWVTYLAANGEPLSHSEMLSSKANAEKNIAASGVLPEHVTWAEEGE